MTTLVGIKVIGASMSKFLDRIKDYQKTTFPEKKAHYASLADGQTPHTFLITCADSRLCPQEISKTQAGEIFVIRNAGNLIPAYDIDNPTNEALTLEYGVSVLGIPEIVVCGHTSCGAMAGLKDIDQVAPLPLVYKALSQYKVTHSEDIVGKDLDSLIQWNVGQQLRNLFSYPFVQKGLKDGSLKVSGMVYDFVNGASKYSCELATDGKVHP